MPTTKPKRHSASLGRRVVATVADVAIGGTALKAVQRAIRTAHSTIEDRDGGTYEDRTRDELYALAAARGIPGRSKMRRDELITALRATRGDPH